MTGIQSSVYIVWICVWNRKEKEENYGKKSQEMVKNVLLL